MYETQTLYIEKILQQFNLDDSKINSEPLPKGANFKKLIFPEESDAKCNFPSRELVGCLLYLSICTRPDISLAVSELPRFLSDPRQRNNKNVLLN